MTTGIPTEKLKKASKKTWWDDLATLGMQAYDKGAEVVGSIQKIDAENRIRSMQNSQFVDKTQKQRVIQQEQAKINKLKEEEVKRNKDIALAQGEKEGKLTRLSSAPKIIKNIGEEAKKTVVNWDKQVNQATKDYEKQLESNRQAIESHPDFSGDWNTFKKQALDKVKNSYGEQYKEAVTGYKTEVEQTGRGFIETDLLRKISGQKMLDAANLGDKSTLAKGINYNKIQQKVQRGEPITPDEKTAYEQEFLRQQGDPTRQFLTQLIGQPEKFITDTLPKAVLEAGKGIQWQVAQIQRDLAKAKTPEEAAIAQAKLTALEVKQQGEREQLAKKGGILETQENIRGQQASGVEDTFQKARELSGTAQTGAFIGEMLPYALAPETGFTRGVGVQAGKIARGLGANRAVQQAVITGGKNFGEAIVFDPLVDIPRIQAQVAEGKITQEEALRQIPGQYLANLGLSAGAGTLFDTVLRGTPKLLGKAGEQVQRAGKLQDLKKQQIANREARALVKEEQALREAEARLGIDTEPKQATEIVESPRIEQKTPQEQTAMLKEPIEEIPMGQEAGLVPSLLKEQMPVEDIKQPVTLETPQKVSDDISRVSQDQPQLQKPTEPKFKTEKPVSAKVDGLKEEVKQYKTLEDFRESLKPKDNLKDEAKRLLFSEQIVRGGKDYKSKYTSKGLSGGSNELEEAFYKGKIEAPALTKQEINDWVDSNTGTMFSPFKEKDVPFVKKYLQDNFALDETPPIESKISPVKTTASEIQQPLKTGQFETPEVREKGFVESIKQAENIKPEVKKAFDQIDTTYTGKSNRETILNAQKRIQEKGLDKSRAEIISKEIQKLNDDDIAEGIEVAKQLQRQGDIEAAVEMFEKLADTGTAKGREVQIFRTLSAVENMTPESAVYMAQKKISKTLEEGKFKDKIQKKDALTNEIIEGSKRINRKAGKKITDALDEWCGF